MTINRGEKEAIVAKPANRQFPLTVQKQDDHYVVVTAQGNFFAKTYSSFDAELIALTLNDCYH